MTTSTGNGTGWVSTHRLSLILCQITSYPSLSMKKSSTHRHSNLFLQLWVQVLTLRSLHLWLCATHLHLDDCLNVLVLLCLHILYFGILGQLQTLNLLFEVWNLTLHKTNLTLFLSHHCINFVKSFVLAITTYLAKRWHSQQSSLSTLSLQSIRQSFILFLFSI